VLKEKLIQDRVGNEPILLVVGSDDRSVRAFHQRIPGQNTVSQFYRLTVSVKPTQVSAVKRTSGLG